MISSDKSIEDEFRKLSRHLPDLIFQFKRRVDGTYHVPVASSGIINVFGCTPEDVKDSFDAIAKVIHQEDQQLVFDEIERSAEQMTDFICEARVCLPGKPIQWILTKSTPEKLPDGSISWYGFSANITEQRESLEKIITLSKKQDAILKAIPDMVFEIGMNHIVYEYHSSLNDLLAAPPEVFIGKNFNEVLSKEASDVLSLAILEANEKGYSIGKQYMVELMSGQYWFELSVAPIVLDESQEKRFILLARNITERKHNDNKLIQLSQAVEQSSTSIEITDLNGKIEYVNQQFLKSTGFSYDEVIGANPNILKSGYTKKETYKAMWQAIKSGNIWHGEFLNKKKDGHLFWEDVTITPVRNEDGEIINFLGIKNDISNQKKTDEKFRKIVWNQSHQVRGPLTDILGIINILKMENSPDDKTALLEQLEIAANQLDQVIHKVIDETKKPI